MPGGISGSQPIEIGAAIRVLSALYSPALLNELRNDHRRALLRVVRHNGDDDSVHRESSARASLTTRGRQTAR